MLLFKRIIFTLSVISPALVMAFELLSEGAMNSVSASSDAHLHDMSEHGEDVDSDFEKMPFESSIRIEAEETDEVALQLEFNLVEEVESWANKLGVETGQDFQLTIVDELPPSNFAIPPPTEIKTDIGPEEVSLSSNPDDTGYQFGRSERSGKLLKSKKNSVSYQVESYVERAATINANPHQEQHTFGSTFISDLHSNSNVSITVD